jgi:hypothetical protein
MSLADIAKTDPSKWVQHSEEHTNAGFVEVLPDSPSRYLISSIVLSIDDSGGTKFKVRDTTPTTLVEGFILQGTTTLYFTPPIISGEGKAIEIMLQGAAGPPMAWSNITAVIE